MEILVKNGNYGQELKFCSKNENFGQKWKFWSKMEILVKNGNFSQNSKLSQKSFPRATFRGIMEKYCKLWQ